MLMLVSVGSEVFTVDAHSGTIQVTCDSDVTAALDRESQEEVTLNIEATDSAGNRVSLIK